MKKGELLMEKNIESLNKKHQTQIDIFASLEHGMPFEDAKFLENEVHFQTTSDTPVQRWFPYREGYTQNLVDYFIKELKVTGPIFDPFSGSGTTLLSARKSGLKSFGVDVNPISVLVARVENESYAEEDIRVLKEFMMHVKSLKKSSKIFRTTFPLAQKVFNKEILQSLLQIKDEIRKIQNVKIKSLAFVLWISIIEPLSNIKKEGNGIKYKNRRRTSGGYIEIPKEEWEEKNFPGNRFALVNATFKQKLQIVLEDLKNAYGAVDQKPVIFQGNCLEFDNYFSEQIGFTFFSPPYCNCFDYFEIHKVELWMGDFVANREDVTKLKRFGFRSNISSITGKSITNCFKDLEDLLKLVDPEKLWNKRILPVIRGYFDDFHSLLENLYSRTKDDGYVGIVVGNSAYNGVIIPTDTLIARIATGIGFNVERILITRHLTTSSQQKKELEPLKNYLRESVIILKK